MAEFESPGHLLECLDFIEESGIAEGYPDWTSLPTEAGGGNLTQREAWAAIRVQRRASSIQLPLRDHRGTPFRLSRCGEIDELVHGLTDRLDAPAGPVRAIWDSPERFPWAADTRVREATALATLAGLTVGTDEAEITIQTAARADSTAGQCVQSAERHLAVFASDPVPPITPANLRSLHRRMTGEQALRRSDDTEWPGETPARASLPARMEALCAFASGAGPFMHPVLRAPLLTLWGLHDRFFPSNNIAVSCVLMRWAFSAAGLNRLALSAIAAQRVARRNDMRRALARCADDENDATYVCLEELRLIHRSIDDVETRYRRWRSAHESWVQESNLFRRLNRRQQWLALYSIDHPSHATCLAYHKREFNVVYETARTDLAGLVKFGLFDVRKHGKAQHFRARPDLPSRLRSGAPHESLQFPGPQSRRTPSPGASSRRAPDDGLPAFF